MNLVGIDFEMANGTHGSLCGYALHFAEGDYASGYLRLHPERGGVQERSAYHGIDPSWARNGSRPGVLYTLLRSLPEDTVLAAHDARIDRRELAAWFDMWDLEPIPFTWIDTLKIARLHYGKTAKVGVAAMAEHMGLTVTPHDPIDDALVAKEIAKRYTWGNIQLIKDNA